MKKILLAAIFIAGYCWAGEDSKKPKIQIVVNEIVRCPSVYSLHFKIAFSAVKAPETPRTPNGSKPTRQYITTGGMSLQEEAQIPPLAKVANSSTDSLDTLSTFASMGLKTSSTASLNKKISNSAKPTLPSRILVFLCCMKAQED